MGKKITVPVDIYVPDGYELDSINKIEVKWIANGQDFTWNYAAKFKHIKPAKKVIDLSCIVGKGIDCEFGDIYLDDAEVTSVGVLVKKERDYYLEKGNFKWKYCRVRQSPHVHFWGGGHKCPLPEGLDVKLYWLNDGLNVRAVKDYINFHWPKVIAFEIFGVAEGWRYEWEDE